MANWGNLPDGIQSFTGHTNGVSGSLDVLAQARNAVTFDTVEAGSTLSIPSKQNGNVGVGLP